MYRKKSNEIMLRYIYILSIDNRGEKSKYYGRDKIFYTGQTNNLKIRLHQHIKGINSTFLNRYYQNAKKILVYIDYIYGTEQDAIKKECIIKQLSKEKKIELIKSEKNCLVAYKPMKAIVLKDYKRRFEEIVLKF